MSKKRKRKKAIDVGRIGPDAAIMLRSRKAFAHKDKRDSERGEDERRSIQDSTDD